MPVLFIAAGRQRVGKTTVLNALIDHALTSGATPAIWNVDQQNDTHHLAAFFPGVLSPDTSEPDEVKDWLEARIADQGQRRYDAFLDVGGGEYALTRLVEDLDIVRSLEGQGIRVVLCNVMGPDTADLDYLARLTRNEAFVPEASLLVLNGGLIVGKRSVATAFKAIYDHEVLKDATARGAKVVVFPALSCMEQVNVRKLRVSAAAAGFARPDLGTLSFFDQERVARWLRREFAEFVGLIPTLWLPAPAAAADVPTSDVAAAD